MGLLVMPKLLGWILLGIRASERRKFGGSLLAFAGLIFETCLSGLIAPVMMIFQSSAVAEVLLGRDAGWQVQRRDDGEWARRELIRRCAAPTLVGVGMTASAFAVSLPLLLWMAPVILGLVLSIPIAMLSSRRSGSKMFRTPEQIAPPRVLGRANELADISQEAIACPLLELRNDPGLYGTHVMNLPGEKPRSPAQINPQLAIARAKIEHAESFDELLGYLAPEEKFAVLCSPTTLRALIEMPRGTVKSP
jgi:membrane glycosyltransferase